MGQGRSVFHLTLEVKASGLIADLAEPLLVGERKVAVVVPLAGVLSITTFRSFNIFSVFFKVKHCIRKPKVDSRGI